jgi:hypothetical protein
MMSLGREMPNFFDMNLNPAGTYTTTYAFSGGPLNGQSIAVPVYVSKCPTAGCTTAVLNPAYGHMTEIFSNVNSSYNALVLQLNRRMTNGLQTQVSYTWSHALDNGQNYTTFTGNNSIYDPANPKLEYGDSVFDVRHRIVGSIVWQPQFFKDSGRFTKAMLNGWSLAPILTFNSGLPYTGGTSGNPTLPTGYSYDWSGFNGSGGTNRIAQLMQRNTFRGPWLENIDLRLSRKFQITERHAVEAIAEVFNLFNHNNVSNVNTTMYQFCTASSCGAASNTLVYNSAFLSPTAEGVANLVVARQLQFAVKYTF